MIGQIIGAVTRGLPSMGEPVRWGSTLDWATRLSLVISALILLGILASLLLYRDRQTSGNALWLSLISLAVLPLVLIPIGNFAVFETATEVRFCGTCHLVMKPYVDDLHDAKSHSLAAAHFQQRSSPGTECYSCHSDYGMHGTYAAKLEGMRHVYKYWTSTYTFPIKMYPPGFSNELCLKCHNGAKAFMQQAIHLDDDNKVSSDLLTDDTNCTQCHGPAHELPKPRPGAQSAAVR
jgi:nitrate/TMAO reductase-like tetraheme cytochrome c subunit